METIAIDPATQKRRINDMMREGLQAQDPNEPIPFFCECDSKDCFDVVWRTGPQYDEARRDANWRALTEHAPSGRTRRDRAGTQVGIYGPA
jgi:hypothetical protein